MLVITVLGKNFKLVCFTKITVDGTLLGIFFVLVTIKVEGIVTLDGIFDP